MGQQKMIRTQIYFTKKEYEFLLKDSKEKGLAMADIIRRIIDKYYDEKYGN